MKYYYFVTFTASGGLTGFQCSEIRTHFIHKYEECFGCVEQHSSGSDHIHILYSSPTKGAGSLTRVFERMYNRLNIPLVKGVSIKNKSAVNKIGLFHYISKAVKGDPWLIKSWKYTWIQEQCVQNVKNIPRKMLRSDFIWVTQRDAAGLMIEYARATGRSLTSKKVFAEVFANMKSVKYQFAKVRIMLLYTSVLAICGDSRPAFAEVYLALLGLD